MIKSMTGFGSAESQIDSLGKVSVELKSTNHKFLEIIFHLPLGLLALEDRIKKEIESKIKRGRITCAINISESKTQKVFVNKDLLKNYFHEFRNIKKEFKIKDEINIDTLIHLPGVLSLEEHRVGKDVVWPKLKPVIGKALSGLSKMRQNEGKALYGYLKERGKSLGVSIDFISKRFKKAVQEKLKEIQTDEERSSFLKNSDITEEIERLMFHIGNFNKTIVQNLPIGKELDFVAQEMQREANTLAAKSFDAVISGRIVLVKSQIEKIREQVQNVE